MATKITLKDFTEKYTEFFKNASKDELITILSVMASNTEPDTRRDFLDAIFLPKQKQNRLGPDKLEQYGAEILDEIECIKREIVAKTEEEPDWEEYHDDDDRLAGYEEFIGPLSKIICEVNDVFDSGCYAIARTAYAELFAIDVEDNYGRGISICDLENVDLNEARARYLRSIYLVEKPNVRADVLLDAMIELDRLGFEEHPKLNDIISISTEILSEFSLFLTQWIAATQDNSKPQYDAWNREATILLYGIPGMENLAKNEGSKRPRVYLDWINALIAEKNYDVALKAIETALKNLMSDKPIRAAIADLMIFCGRKLNDKEIQFTGAWISFEAKPNLFKLTNLYEQCSEEELLSQMHKAAEIIEARINKPDKYNYERSWEKDNLDIPSKPNESLLLHAYLLSNQIGMAFELAQKGEPLGWSNSSNPQAFFIAYFLVLSTKKPLDKLHITLKKFWSYALNISLDFMWDYGKNVDELFKKIEKIYQKLLLVAYPYDEKIIKWCLAAAEKRITAIVEGKYRQAYERAALLAVACSEALGSADTVLAAEFFNKIKNRFPRHSAFQSALKAEAKEGILYEQSDKY